MPVVTKPRKKIQKIELALPMLLAEKGFSTEFWQKGILWVHPTSRHIVKDINDISIPPAKRSDYLMVCRGCRAPLNQEKTLSCKCFQHVCGSNFSASATSLPSQFIARCQEQAHCHDCCNCIFCKACKFKFATPSKPLVFRDSSPKYPKGFDPQCSCCRDCCRCKPCVTCGNSVLRQCACANKRIPHHADCCDSTERIEACGEHPLILKRAPVFHIGTNFQHNRTRRLLSVETELDYVGNSTRMVEFNKVMKEWNCAVVHDGTVPKGFEINSSPASGDAFLAEMKAITSAITLIDGRLSVRCGTHVHVDARDFRYVDLINLIYLYGKIEPALFGMLPPERRISRFAIPCRDLLMKIAINGQKLVERIKDVELAAYYPQLAAFKKKAPSISTRIAEHLYKSKSLRAQKKIHKNSTNQHLRYMALNLHSWVYRRTIEFRHWPGSTSLEEMSLWPQICGAILDTAKALPVVGNRRRTPSISSLPDHPIEALLTILKPSSKVSRELRSFVEAKLQQWSPDFDVWYPLACIAGRNCVVPFKPVSHDNLSLAFDIRSKAYTYINNRYKANWDYEWGDPTAVHGRYAEISDLLAIPDNGKLCWIMPPMLPRPKSQLQPQTQAQTTASNPLLVYINAEATQVQARANAIYQVIEREQVRESVPHFRLGDDEDEGFLDI